MLRWIRSRHIVAVLVLGAMALFVATGQQSRDVELNTGRGRDRYSILGFTVSETRRPTAISQRIEIASDKPDVWVRVTSYRPWHWTSPHDRYHNAEFLMQVLMDGCEVRHLGAVERRAVAEHLLKLLRNGREEEAGRFVHAVGSETGLALPLIH